MAFFTWNLVPVTWNLILVTWYLVLVTCPSVLFLPRIRQIHRVCRLLPIGLCIHQLEHAFRAGHRDQRLVVLVADDCDGREELVREQEERNQCPDVHVTMIHAPAS